MNAPKSKQGICKHCEHNVSPRGNIYQAFNEKRSTTMKKLLTFALGVVTVAVLVGLGAAQQRSQKQPGGALRMGQPYSQLTERLAGFPDGLNPAVIDRATNEARVPTVPEAMIPWKCTCVASTASWNSGIVHNYGVIATYPITVLNPAKRCSDACSDLVSDKKDIEDATALCAQLDWVSPQGCVRGRGYIGALGTKNADGTAGKLVCTAPVDAVTQQKCPKGWVCNGCDPQVDGGVTTDGKCKQAACGPNHFPPPPNWTLIGEWGFTWGNYFYAWGSDANGGSAITTIISPAVPGSGIWGTCL
jgi:hypothetical protein